MSRRPTASAQLLCWCIAMLQWSCRWWCVWLIYHRSIRLCVHHKSGSVVSGSQMESLLRYRRSESLGGFAVFPFLGFLPGRCLHSYLWFDKRDKRVWWLRQELYCQFEGGIDSFQFYITCRLHGSLEWFKTLKMSAAILSLQCLVTFYWIYVVQ